MVAKGYDQVAGINFQYNFAPVMNDTTFKVMLSTWLQNGFDARLLDVKTAFLYGHLEEDLFIETPEGYELFQQERIDEKPIASKYLKLEKTLYGLVQAAREWWKKFIKVLKDDLGFEQFQNDNCLLKRKNEEGFCAIGIYVDDCFMVGDTKALDQAVSDIKKHFDVTTDDANDFIGCNIEKNEERVLLHQPDLIKRLCKTFEDELKTIRQVDTPASGHFKILRPKEDEPTLNSEAQTKYRSGVGSLLFLVKHTRPDLANAVRELSKVMDGANEGHMKALLRVIKFVEVTKNYKLIFERDDSDGAWKMIAFSDSDYSGDSEDRRSVSGYVIYINGCAVAWRSKGQKSVSLSSTEAEYKAVSEVVTEILFIKMIMEFLNMEVQLPITVNVDNLGAIYLSKSASTSNRTKHIDTHYHFVREYIEDGTVLVQFVRSENNDADIFTKNLPGDSFKRHSKRIMKNEYDPE